MTTNRPNILIYVVYRTSNGKWRGFCSPFDVTCEADSSKEARKRLEKMVDVYIEGLEKYNYPKHLAIRDLTEKEDKKIFQVAWKKIQSILVKRAMDSYINYQTIRGQEEVKLTNPQGLISYQPQPCYA